MYDMFVLIKNVHIINIDIGNISINNMPRMV